MPLEKPIKIDYYTNSYTENSIDPLHADKEATDIIQPDFELVLRKDLITVKKSKNGENDEDIS